MELADFKLQILPSLQYLAGVQIGAALLSNPEVVNQAFKRTSFGPGGIKVTYSMLDKKISALSLPRKLCQKVEIITMNMIDELKLWKVSSRHSFRPSQACTIYLCWTHLGALDRLKTARKLVNSPIDIISSYQLACKHCFFYDACNIWEIMSEEERNRSQIRTLLDRFIRDTSTENRSPDAFIRWMGRCWRMQSCNEWEFRFILDVIAPEERLPVLKEAARNIMIHRNFRHHCFQQLDEISRQEVLDYYYPFVISPFQTRFLELSDRACALQFRHSLLVILEELSQSFWQNFELVEIFQQLWHRSPNRYKEDVYVSSAFELLNILLNCNCLESLNIDSVDEAYRNSIRFRSTMFFRD